MDTISGEQMVQFYLKNGGCGILHRYIPLKDLKGIVHRLAIYSTPFFISVGSIFNDKERIDLAIKLSNKYEEVNICVDLAHGHSLHMKETLSYIKNKCIYTMAGNVVTPEGAKDLHSWGAYYVKVGIGQGSVCETTLRTGVGYPQMDALIKINQECPNIKIISDGGIQKPADYCKAMAIPTVIAVMAGGIFAGTDMTPNWKPYEPCKYRGMASKGAKESIGENDTYIEGTEILVPSKGPGSTKAVFDEYTAALQSAMSYSNARNLVEYKEKVKLEKIQ